MSLLYHANGAMNKYPMALAKISYLLKIVNLERQKNTGNLKPSLSISATHVEKIFKQKLVLFRIIKKNYSGIKN